MAALQADEEGAAPALVQTVVCDKVAALHAAQAICAALLARERGAGGQHLELSLLGTTLAFLWPDGMEAQTLVGEGVTAPATRMRDIAHIHPTRDGFVTVMAVSDEQFHGLCRALRLPEIARDPRFQSLQGRLDHARALAGPVRDALGRLATREACERLVAEGVPVAPASSPEAVLTDPHVLETRLFREIDHPRAGRLRTPRPAVDFGGVAPPPAGARARARPAQRRDPGRARHRPRRRSSDCSTTASSGPRELRSPAAGCARLAGGCASEARLARCERRSPAAATGTGRVLSMRQRRRPAGW